jgi:hypothetical protein
MELQPYNFDDCKKQIMSEKQEISGELLSKTHFVVDTSGSQIEVYKTEINKYKSQIEILTTDIDKHKDELNKKDRVVKVAVITASGAFITAIASIVVALINTVWKTEVDQYIAKERKFITATEDIQVKKGQELTKAIGIIEVDKDEIFKRKPELQWKTVKIIAKVLRDKLSIKKEKKSVIKNKDKSGLIERKYGSFSKDNAQTLINIIKFESEKT